MFVKRIFFKISCTNVLSAFQRTHFYKKIWKVFFNTNIYSIFSEISNFNNHLHAHTAQQEATHTHVPPQREISCKKMHTKVLRKSKKSRTLFFEIIIAFYFANHMRVQSKRAAIRVFCQVFRFFHFVLSNARRFQFLDAHIFAGRG